MSHYSGSTRVWTPKSVTFRRMLITPDIVPPVGHINEISYPILKVGNVQFTENVDSPKNDIPRKCYFNGTISLIDNFRLFAFETVKFYSLLLDFERVPEKPLEDVERRLNFR